MSGRSLVIPRSLLKAPVPGTDPQAHDLRAPRRGREPYGVDSYILAITASMSGSRTDRSTSG